ncbi:MAG: hypothetical protein OXJ64_07420 [Boseongicola sp.]|nr:hypothetical protein [Boseongicola sp.]
MPVNGVADEIRSKYIALEALLDAPATPVGRAAAGAFPIMA